MEFEIVAGRSSAPEKRDDDEKADRRQQNGARNGSSEQCGVPEAGSERQKARAQIFYCIAKFFKNLPT